ncbi:efflux RND transporter periplasmic adaptor subunit [Aestuariivirga sp.]|uniref:efflux RND transporter periplasmic adaptor subunit n=1 Tax=Aestuariivirga sp. TaxID=2650926 RepID=UPI003593A985
MKHAVKWMGIAIGLVLASLVAGCDDAPKETVTQQAPPPSVTVVKVETRDLRPSVSFSGRVTALQRVDLRARIEGFLDKQNFQEGAKVKTGDLLYVIEKAPYEARVTAAKGALETASARLTRAEIEYDRQATLVKKEASAQTKLDDARAARDEARGNVAKLTAEVEQANLQLSYTEIRAPIDGRIGESILSAGNYVSPSSGTLATIVAVDPIGVTFPVSQREIIAVREQSAADVEIGDRVVYVEFGKGKRYPAPGKVDFMDVAVNPGTDAVNIRAVFPNPDGLLIDGQLVTAVVESDKPRPSMVIPISAVQIDQTGPFVLSVSGDNKIEVRRVELGPVTGQLVVVLKGLADGDRVVTEGVQKVRPGQVVEPVEVKPEA